MPTASTLATIVDANPGAARILERHHLDYCCGGRRTLDDACTQLGIDAATVRAELDAAAATAPADWTSLGVSELVDHIEGTHHRYLHEELPRLHALTDKVVGVHAGRHPELTDVATAYAELRADLEPHLMKEEQVLFPMIRELAVASTEPSFHCGSIANPIKMMMLEHDQTGELLARLRDLTADYSVPDDACGSYRALYDGLAELEADTHLHVHKENNVLFPAVLAIELPPR
jgi:regulator of cell morphogenesis and NO signaling